MKHPIKRILACTLAMALLLGVGTAGASGPSEIILPAAQAEVSGQGVSRTQEVQPTVYDETTNTVTSMGTGSAVTYTVPDGVDGVYDLYLTVSKSLTASSSAPFGLSINGGVPHAFPLHYGVSGDSPFAYTEDGEWDVGSLTDTGRFLVERAVALKSGDTVTITGLYGSSAAALPDLAYPDVGDLLLAAPGAEVATGYDNTVKPAEPTDPSDPLSGLNIIWLGSSVTFGTQSGGYYSMADAIADRHAATICEKYAIGGTTLVNTGTDSYVARMKTIDTNRRPDLFVVQLSTNDATSHKPYGEMSGSFDPASFDDATIIGAMETIISYVRAVFDCPVVFYTGSYYDSEEYSTMVDALLKLQEKWGIGVVNLFHNEEMVSLYDTEQYHVYMHDTIHPFRQGYIEWWTPAFEAYFTEFLAAQNKTTGISAQKVVFDGAETQVEAYNVDGQNYLKLRDVASALTESDLKFDIAYEAGTASLLPGQAYTAVGGECTAGTVPAQEALVKTNTQFELDGKTVSMDAYNIGGSNFCKLSDLFKALGCGIGWHPESNTVYLTSKGGMELPETPDQAEQFIIPSKYTKCQTVVFEKLGLDILVAMNEEETEFCLSFNAFGNDQLLYGTLENGTPTVTYDKTGFFTNDTPTILASVDADAWEMLVQPGVVPARYTKTQTVIFEKLGIEIQVCMDEEESEFFLTFNAFGNDQLLYGTMENGAPAVAYDKTGFFTNDVPAILGSATPEAWTMVIREGEIPAKYTKTQTVVFEKLGIEIQVCMNEEESEFFLTFNAFGNDQLLYGTVKDGTPTVAYDKTGFFTNDVPTILGSVNAAAWEAL